MENLPQPHYSTTVMGFLSNGWGPYFNYARSNRGREYEHESVWFRTGREGGFKVDAYTVAYAMEPVMRNQ